jgi:RNA polymerase-binding transcription factor DksA
MSTSLDDIVARLQAELAEAEKELADVTEEATHPPQVELGGGSAGYSTWQAAVVLQKHIENRIVEIESALGRAREGLYGVCEVCGEQIPEERMQLLPFTTHCVKHA